MGTRIYPTTRNSAIIEILAGVPSGTHKNLTDIRIQNRKRITEAQDNGVDYGMIQELEYQQWQNLHKTPEGILDGFLTFGWGKFTKDSFDIVKDHIPSDEDEDWMWNGGTTDVALIDSILEAQGVDLEKLGVTPQDLEGLCWG